MTITTMATVLHSQHGQSKPRISLYLSLITSSMEWGPGLPFAFIIILNHLLTLTWPQKLRKALLAHPLRIHWQHKWCFPHHQDSTSISTQMSYWTSHHSGFSFQWWLGPRSCLRAHWPPKWQRPRVWRQKLYNSAGPLSGLWLFDKCTRWSHHSVSSL